MIIDRSETAATIVVVVMISFKVFSSATESFLLQVTNNELVDLLWIHSSLSRFKSLSSETCISSSHVLDSVSHKTGPLSMGLIVAQLFLYLVNNFKLSSILLSKLRA